MAYRVMACIVMACIVMACRVAAYIVFGCREVRHQRLDEASEVDALELGRDLALGVAQLPRLLEDIVVALYSYGPK